MTLLHEVSIGAAAAVRPGTVLTQLENMIWYTALTYTGTAVIGDSETIRAVASASLRLVLLSQLFVVVALGILGTPALAKVDSPLAGSPLAGLLNEAAWLLA
ncbi:hypothetical protein EYF80_024446 [Liparis tanakae]|uniref:Uncharacterized protein n=1 Tax=Liparis tanakae TaxID=230148 RepID=A0A4Z2HK98_9TELE|nr:hypothetical protein EYF80_024446 [Liparis tanakae]